MDSITARPADLPALIRCAWDCNVPIIVVGAAGICIGGVTLPSGFDETASSELGVILDDHGLDGGSAPSPAENEVDSV